MAVLAESRDGVLFTGEVILEGESMTPTSGADILFDALHTVLTEDVLKGELNAGVFLTCFHGYIIPHWGRIARGKKKKMGNVSLYATRV